MDPRTAAALCLVDLAPLIEAGEFHKFRVAEGVVEAAVSASPTDWHRGGILYYLDDQLRDFEAPDRPACDGYLRALRATVQHLRQRRFDRSRLTARAAGA